MKKWVYIESKRPKLRVLCGNNTIFDSKMLSFDNKNELNWMFWDIWARKHVRLIVPWLIWRSISYFLCLFLFTYFLFIIFYLLTNEKQMTSTFQKWKDTLRRTTFLKFLRLASLSNPYNPRCDLYMGHLRSLLNKNKCCFGHLIRKNK